MSSERVSEILKRVCRITASDDPATTIGTGFLVGEDLVASCWHVIDSDPAVTYSVVFDMPDDRDDSRAVRIPVTAVHSNADYPNDVALFQLAEPVGAANRRGHERLPDTPGAGDEKGAEIHVVGYPLGLSLRHTVGTILSAYDGNATVAHDAFTQEGNSGSPVFDSSLRLRGMHFYNQEKHGSQMLSAWAMPKIFKDHLAADALPDPAPLPAHQVRDRFEAAGLVYPYLRDRAVCDVLVIHSSGMDEPLAGLDLLWNSMPTASLRRVLQQARPRLLATDDLTSDELTPQTRGLLEHAGVILLLRQDGDNNGFDNAALHLAAMPERKAVTALLTNALTGRPPQALHEWRELSLVRPDDINYAASTLDRLLRFRQVSEFTPRADAIPRADPELNPVYVATGQDWTAAEWRTYDYLLNELQRGRIPLVPCLPFARADNPANLEPEHLVIAILRGEDERIPFPDHDTARLLAWKNAQTAVTTTDDPGSFFIASEADFIVEALRRARANRAVTPQAASRFALVVYNQNDADRIKVAIEPVLLQRNTVWVPAAWSKVNPVFDADDADLQISNECIFTVGNDVLETKLMFRHVFDRLRDSSAGYRGYACLLSGQNWKYQNANWLIVHPIDQFDQIY